MLFIFPATFNYNYHGTFCQESSAITSSQHRPVKKLNQIKSLCHIHYHTRMTCSQKKEQEITTAKNRYSGLENKYRGLKINRGTMFP